MPFIRQKRLEELLMAGGVMSNVCFNLKQSDAIDTSARELLRGVQVRWDKAQSGPV